MRFLDQLEAEQSVPLRVGRDTNRERLPERCCDRGNTVADQLLAHAPRLRIVAPGPVIGLGGNDPAHPATRIRAIAAAAGDQVHMDVGDRLPGAVGSTCGRVRVANGDHAFAAGERPVDRHCAEWARHL